jgi:hypothetical protein
MEVAMIDRKIVFRSGWQLFGEFMGLGRKIGSA